MATRCLLVCWKPIVHKRLHSDVRCDSVRDRDCGLSVLLSDRFSKRNSRLIDWTIKPSGLYLDFVLSVILTPTMMFASHMFRLILVRPTARDCAFFGLLLVCYVVNACLIVPVRVFVTNTFYSTNKVTFNYSPYHFICFSVVNSIAALFGGMFRAYPKWTVQVLMAIHIAAVVVLFAWMVRIIYISHFTNALFMSVLVTQAFCDALRLSGWDFNRTWIGVIVVCVVVCVFLIALLAIHLYFGKIRRLLSYNGKMSMAEYPDSERVKPTLTDDEKEEAIAALKLRRRTAITYLFVGLMYCSDYVIDMTLIRYLMYSDNSTYCLTHLLHVVCYFPTTIKLLDKIYRELKQRRDLSTVQNFLLFEVYRVKVQRLTSSTPMSIGRVAELRATSLTLEAQQRGFWTGHGAHIGQLLVVGNKARVIDGQWQELLRFNSNSIAYHEDYLRFLVEVRCDFQEAVHMRNRIDIMERKRIRKADQCFIRFVQMFPQYLRRKIVSPNGTMLAYHAKRDDGASGTQSSSANSHDEVDVPTEELLAKRILRYGNLSLALGKAVKNLKPHSRVGFTIYAFWALFGSIASLCLTFGLCYSLLDGPRSTTVALQRMFDVHRYLGQTFLAVTVNYARKTNKFLYDASLFDHQTSVWEDPNTNFDLFGWNLSLQSANAFSAFATEATNLAINDPDSKWLSDAFMNNITAPNLCFDGKRYYSTNSDIGSVSSFIVSYATSVFCKETDWANIWTNNDYWCVFVYSEWSLSLAYEYIMENVMNNIIQQVSKVSNACTTMIPIAPVLYILLFVIGTPIFTGRVIHEISTWYFCEHAAVS